MEFTCLNNVSDNIQCVLHTMWLTNALLYYDVVLIVNLIDKFFVTIITIVLNNSVNLKFVKTFKKLIEDKRCYNLAAI